MRAWLSGAATLLLVGCGGGGSDAGPVDGGTDASAIPAAPDIPWLLPDGGVELPVTLTPCPAGWREVLSASRVTTCDPYPEGGPATCPAGEAHFPGEPACAPVGSACPAGDFAEGLPDDGTVLFVLAGAAAGGDGSRERPFAGITEALGRAGAGMTVAVGRGSYDEALTLRAGLTLAGACTGATVVAYTGADPRSAVVNVQAAGVTVRELTIGPSDRAGIAVAGEGELRLEGVAVEGATVAGIRVDRGGSLIARGLVVRDTRPEASGAFGRGLNVQEGATVEASRALFERNREIALFAGGPGTSLVLADSVVRDTRSDGAAGRGLDVESGASALVSRVLFERNRELAVFVSNPGSSLALTDAVVRDTEGRTSDATGGRGLFLREGARAELSRVLFERNRTVGLYAGSPGTSLVVHDTVVRDTRNQQSDFTGGRGLSVEDGARAEVSRALFERNRELAVSVDHSGTTLVLADAVVRDTESARDDDGGGRGLNVQRGATVEVIRALFERNRELALFAGSDGASIVLTDVVVRDTRPSASGLGGIGAGSFVSASIVLRRFLLTGSPLAGVQLGRGGTVDLHEGEISRSLIGVNVQTEGFDLARLQDRVLYRENGRDLATDELPVPDPMLPPGDP